MTDVMTKKESGAAIMERVLITGDLSKLTPEERVTYYTKTCESVGLNPLTRPFEYLHLSGKLTLYARKECTDQLRSIHSVSIPRVERELIDGIFTVTAYATNKDGRNDSDIGAVPIEQLRGAEKANAMMRAITKAKRRVTLSICGLGGMLDESELDELHDAQVGRAMNGPESEIDDERMALKASIEESLRKRGASVRDAKIFFKAYLDAEEPVWARIDVSRLKDLADELRRPPPKAEAKEAGTPGAA